MDPGYCLLKRSDGTVLIPILLDSVSQLDMQHLKSTVAPGSICEVTWSQTLSPKRRAAQTGVSKLQQILQEELESVGDKWTEELSRDLPHSFERHGDLVLLGDKCFSNPSWGKIDGSLWSTVAKGLGAKRLAKMTCISSNSFRTPVVEMLLGEHSLVTHVDNGIRYEFDVTKCMFSSGNITEKLRVARFNCKEETVVDLYAGIGYFTLPYLVHAGAAHVHACEWNPDAVQALQKNLKLNKVYERCTIHQGDNRQLQLNDTADRVNLGLIPSSEDGWPVACRLLKRSTGGILHIHHNVTSPMTNSRFPEISDGTQRVTRKENDREAWQGWACDTSERLCSLLKDTTGTDWRTHVQHIEHVKSYAPHIHHVVLDLECRPLLGEMNCHQL